MDRRNFFEWYREQASSKDISETEMVGRFAEQNANEHAIFPDLLNKIPNLSNDGIKVVDIGCGCSKPVLDLIESGEEHNQELVLIDSAEMLDNIVLDETSAKKVEKAPICFPEYSFVDKHEGTADVVISISVFQCAFYDSNFIDFVDSAVRLLKSGGYLLLADIPNGTKKKRFLNSEEGAKFHMAWAKTQDKPEVTWSEFESMSLDDSTIFYLLQRYRNMGFETYLLPQNEGLPFSNTREDILIRRW